MKNCNSKILSLLLSLDLDLVTEHAYQVQCKTNVVIEIHRFLSVKVICDGALYHQHVMLKGNLGFLGGKLKSLCLEPKHF